METPELQQLQQFKQFRTMPIGYAGCTLVRQEDGKKAIVDGKGKIIPFSHAMPPNWTVKYGKQAKAYKPTPLIGIICGPLANKLKHEIEVIALDCDNDMAWQVFTALDPDYRYRFKSIGKPGGTILYKLPAELRELKQYSIKANGLYFEYMSQRESGPNAMIYAPTLANQTKEQIPQDATLATPPAQVIAMLKQLQPAAEVSLEPSIEHSKSTLPFNEPLVKQFVQDAMQDEKFICLGYADEEPSARTKRVYQIFTPKKFRQTKYKQQGYLHPDDDEILQYGSWSEYIVGVSAIAGADLSISPELYVQFIQAINAQTREPMPAKRLLTEVITPMIKGKAKIHGQPIWRYNQKWDQQSHTIVNQYGETLEYFILEDSANTFVEYNHTTTTVLTIQGVRALRDQIYSRDSDAQQIMPPATIVKRLKLIQIRNSIKEDVGVVQGNDTHAILNTATPVLPLRVLRQPQSFPGIQVSEDHLQIQAFNIFLRHLLNDDQKAITFLKQVLAYHGKHLKPMPVILYMVGVGGAGKSHFATMLETLFGANATRRPSAKQCASHFNDFLENCALLVLTETSDVSPREQAALKAILKTVTGEKFIDIETKNKPLRAGVPLFALPLLLANEPWYTEDTADRRLFSIMPKTSLPESQLVNEFEQQTGVRIINTILKGINSGVISKYLAQFCPEELPEVPLLSLIHI